MNSEKKTVQRKPTRKKTPHQHKTLQAKSLKEEYSKSVFEVVFTDSNGVYRYQGLTSLKAALKLTKKRVTHLQRFTTLKTPEYTIRNVGQS